jgi:hypothetical protein
MQKDIQTFEIQNKITTNTDDSIFFWDEEEQN